MKRQKISIHISNENNDDVSEIDEGAVRTRRCTLFSMVVQEGCGDWAKLSVRKRDGFIRSSCSDSTYGHCCLFWLKDHVWMNKDKNKANASFSCNCLEFEFYSQWRCDDEFQVGKWHSKICGLRRFLRVWKMMQLRVLLCNKLTGTQ